MKVLKFGAIWCKECLVMRPMWEEIEADMPNLKTEYYDADLNPEVIKKYEVKNLPVFIFLDKNDNEISRLKGIQNKEDLVRIVKENIDK
ncbi:thioredoxin family protein [Candidatus Parcubacteria bacterium]|nr:thioredoxin family protein [Candidatus Parcubacteria bacterium]